MLNTFPLNQFKWIELKDKKKRRLPKLKKLSAGGVLSGAFGAAWSKKKIDAGGGAGGAGGAGGGQPPRARQGGRVGGYREVGGAQAAI